MVPFKRNQLVALIVPVKERFPSVPVSVKLRSVFGVASESVIVKTPLVPAVARLILGVPLVNARGVSFESVTKPDAFIVVAPLIAPVSVIPPELLSILPVILAPSALIVIPPVLIV